MSLLVGLMGGGQLGQMLAEAGKPLGMRFRAIDSAADACAFAVCDEKMCVDFSDAGALDEFAKGLDLATYEWENVPVAAARRVAARVPEFYPSPEVLEMAQDRLLQKNFVRGLGLETAAFEGVGTRAELESAVERLGMPAVLKTRRDGYDGKGQFVLRAAADLDAAWERLGEAAGRSGLVVEAFVPFAREVSLIAVRGRDTTMAFYPLGENEHGDGILRVTRVPLPLPSEEAAALQREAERAARKILELLDYVGVLSIEFFQLGGRLLINEVATRVHNSGHWTQDGAATSQFENHLRAIASLPLGPTTLLRPTAMINLIGTVPVGGPLAIPGARVHLYGKEPRAGRKLGHVNIPLN